MAKKDVILGVLFATLVVLTKASLWIFTPLFLDCLTPTSTVLYNISFASSCESSRYSHHERNWTVCRSSSLDPFSGVAFSAGPPVPYVPYIHYVNTTPSWQRIDPLFGIWFSMGFDTFLFGFIVLYLKFFTNQITERETSYPKSTLILSGSCQALCALMYQFSSSGSRTAPYLQGALGYFLIPITFSLRFLILGARPGRRKLICAGIIVLGEFTSLIPTIFPHLENEASKQKEGGASGAGRILWPLCFAAKGIPHALWNILLEKSVKAKQANEGHEAGQPNLATLNMAYVMFWNFFGTFVTTCALFWMDLIPGFGLLPDIKLFPQQFLFNMRCIFGATPVCGFHQIFTAWGRILVKTTFFILVGFLLRYGEGANFYAILGAINIPLVFLFFTLFDEQPFRWDPHATLSTWLSVGALVVMLPTVIIYDAGFSLKSPGGSKTTAGSDLRDQLSAEPDEDAEQAGNDRRPLLPVQETATDQECSFPSNQTDNPRS